MISLLVMAFHLKIHLPTQASVWEAHGLTHFELNTFAPLTLKNYSKIVLLCYLAFFLSSIIWYVNSRTRCWIPVGQPGTMVWWIEFTATATASALLTAGHCQLTNMGDRYPFYNTIIRMGCAIQF